MSVDCVILAAGLSSRMGKNKMLLSFGGSTVLESCIGTFYDCCSKIIVVTGRYHEEVRQCLSRYTRVSIVYNGDYPLGMFSSVKAGVRHVESGRFLLTPGDYPLIKAATAERMINAGGRFAVPVYSGQPGHPVLLDGLFAPVILASSARSLRECLEKTGLARQEISVDDAGVITDIDTAEEYKAVIEKAKLER